MDFLSAVESSNGGSKKKLSEIQEDREGKIETPQLQHELSNEIEVLSIENGKIKASFGILEKGIIDMNTAFETIKESFSTHEKRVKTLISQIEDKFEAKLQVYNEELRKEMKKETSSIKNSFHDKMHNLEAIVKKHCDDNKLTTLVKEVMQRIIKVEIDSGEAITLIDKVNGRIKDIEDHLDTQDIDQDMTNKVETITRKINSLEEKISNMENSRSPAVAVQYPYAEQLSQKNSGSEAFRQTQHDSTQRAQLMSGENQPNQHDDYARNRTGKARSSYGRQRRSLIVLMDSNRRLIDSQLLWKDCKLIPCNTLERALEIIDSV